MTRQFHYIQSNFILLHKPKSNYLPNLISHYFISLFIFFFTLHFNSTQLIACLTDLRTVRAQMKMRGSYLFRGTGGGRGARVLKVKKQIEVRIIYAINLHFIFT